ncbi:hypothetical protein J1N35_028322 [Gossypium stocksii]|uniref:Uncharacterized protein n=1 Tax=Gossypium stocksii TaxID=47602 RepID=A0A9D3UW50_9ROSI|nr:hypothetical protein J1N35_028322 [Gossypium stocksii]
MLAVLCSVNEEGADYLCNIPFEQWTQAYDGGLRYGHMTSNLAECINFVLKGMHHFLITLVVRKTYFHLAALFPKRTASYEGQMHEGHVWCRKVLQQINKANVWTNIMHIVCHDRDNLWFRVTEFDKPHQACQNFCLDPMSYVDEVYKIEYMYNVWRHVFPPVPNEHSVPHGGRQRLRVGFLLCLAFGGGCGCSGGDSGSSGRGSGCGCWEDDPP